MPKFNVMVQLFVDGSAVWQVTEPMAPELAFKLSDEELKEVGVSMRALLIHILSARTGVPTHRMHQSVEATPEKQVTAPREPKRSAARGRKRR